MTEKFEMDVFEFSFDWHVDLQRIVLVQNRVLSHTHKIKASWPVLVTAQKMFPLAKHAQRKHGTNHRFPNTEKNGAPIFLLIILCYIYIYTNTIIYIQKQPLCG